MIAWYWLFQSPKWVSLFSHPGEGRNELYPSQRLASIP